MNIKCKSIKKNLLLVGHDIKYYITRRIKDLRNELSSCESNAYFLFDF